MAVIEQAPGGDLISVTLDESDFRRGAWREFLDRLKSLDGWTYDGETQYWYVPAEHFEIVCEWERELLLREDPRQERMF